MDFLQELIDRSKAIHIIYPDKSRLFLEKTKDNFQYQTWQDMPEDELEEAIYKWRMNAIVDHLYTVRTEFLNDIVDLIAIRHDIELESEG